MEPITAYVRENGTNNGYTEHRAECCIFRVTSSTQTSHVDNLRDLEQNSNNNHIRDMDTNGYDMRLVWEEESK